MPRRILGKDGKVTGIECVKTKAGQYDRDGKFLLVPIEGTEFTVEADTVIVAIGQQADLDFLPEKIQVGRGKTIVTDPFTLETSMKGVFAGGDVLSGPASVFEAIYAGWRAAGSIDSYLRTATPR
jgi:NADPH-dependent glutamate synthase beta subunit-like oxidoreductase